MSVGHGLHRARESASRALSSVVACAVLVGCGQDAGDQGSSGSEPAVGADAVPVADPAVGAAPGAAPDSDLVGCAQNLLIISLDTLRADRLEPYGYGRPTSENLDAFSERAFVFEEARSQSAQTAPAHASLFTSEYPGAHRIINVHGHSPSIPRLPPGVTTLAELLHEAGLETAGFVSGGNLTSRMDMGRGFEVWDERLDDMSERVDSAVRWLLAPERSERRFFAFVHTYQVHAPYLPPAELVPDFVDGEYQGLLRPRLEHYLSMSTADAWAAAVGPAYWEGLLDYDEEDVAFLSDLYDAEIAYADAEFRRLLSFLFKSGALARTAVIVLSDHGEEFREHGKYQHDQVFEEHLRVPLIVRLPKAMEERGFRGRVETPVGLVDVAPTAADLVGVDWSGTGWSGRSLVPLMEGRVPEWAGDPVFAELVVDPGPKTYRSVVWQGWKYIHAWQEDKDYTWDWLFDLRADPGERNNLFDSEAREAVRAREALQGQLAQHVAACQARAQKLGTAGSAPVDEAMRQLMIQLGYVGAEDH